MRHSKIKTMRGLMQFSLVLWLKEANRMLSLIHI